MSTSLYKDSSLSVEVRARDLLSRMTLEEKVAQLGSVWSYELLDNTGNFSKEKAEDLLKKGIGQITRPGGATTFVSKGVAKFVNEIQRFLVEETRLGIPAIMHEECLTGYMGLGATNFPQAIAMASTWDPDLIERMALAIREDMRKIGAHQGLAPVLDVARDPRWGRTEETFGESPYLVAKMGVSYIKGLQGENIKKGVIATAKHFVGYSASEGGRNWAPTNIPDRELREIFMFPFEAAIREGEVLSIMNSYSEIDGVPCASSRKLLTDILRKEWGFDGVVVSDYFSIKVLNDYHRIAKDKKEAAKYAVKAGIDIELPTIDCYLTLIELVKEGVISEKLIDETAFRILKIKFMLELFENPYVDVENANIRQHRDLALEIAKKSIVIIKNDGILPLNKFSKIAVIGPNAADVRNLLGDYSYLTQRVEETVEASLKKIPSILDVIKEENPSILYAKGCEVTGNLEEGFLEAVEIARQSEVVVMVVGDKSGLTSDCTTGESRDNANLKFPGVQEELILEVAKIGKPIVLVLVTGRPYSLKNVVDKVNAIVEMWLPGEAGGKALVDVLWGKINPGGRLPISFPRSAGQIPVFHYVKPSGGRSNWHGDYVDESVKPLFPFGHGLSYTTFEYSNLRIEPEEIPPAGIITVKINVKNIGNMEGDEVVQLYIGREHASVTRPVKELKGFKRITLKPKEEKTITFKIYADILAYYDNDMKLVIEPGVFKVMIGSSSEDIRLSGEFEIIGEEKGIVGGRKFFTEVEVE